MPRQELEKGITVGLAGIKNSPARSIERIAGRSTLHPSIDNAGSPRLLATLVNGVLVLQHLAKEVINQFSAKVSDFCHR